MLLPSVVTPEFHEHKQKEAIFTEILSGAGQSSKSQTSLAFSAMLCSWCINKSPFTDEASEFQKCKVTSSVPHTS